jgi:hypothetical protein
LSHILDKVKFVGPVSALLDVITMAKQKTQMVELSSSPAMSDHSPGRPEVIVEFLFDDGLFFISLRNIGDRPAVGVSVRFDKKIVSPDGQKDISSLPLFRNLEFLGPGREIVAFLDSSSSYFQRKQPTKISARITYSDSEKRKYEVTINHNLEVYRELPYLPSLPRDHQC